LYFLIFAYSSYSSTSWLVNIMLFSLTHINIVLEIYNSVFIDVQSTYPNG
jgi:hypothetical protein